MKSVIKIKIAKQKNKLVFFNFEISGVLFTSSEFNAVYITYNAVHSKGY